MWLFKKALTNSVLYDLSKDKLMQERNILFHHINTRELLVLEKTSKLDHPVWPPTYHQYFPLIPVHQYNI